MPRGVYDRTKTKAQKAKKTTASKTVKKAPKAKAKKESK
jgi:hypothetical protein